MNLVWHQFKKDVRGVWPLLVLGLGVVALRLLNLVWLDPSWTDSLPNFRFTNESEDILDFAQFFLMTIVIARLIQSESLVLTNAFWVTRPISSSILLKSKSFFVFLLIFIPIFLELIVLALNQFTELELFQAFIEMVTIYSFLVILSILLAVLTRNFSYFILVGLCFVIFYYLISYLINRIDFLPESKAINLGILESQHLAKRCLVIVGGSGIIVYQYGKRNTVFSWKLSLLLLLSWFLVPYIWAHNFFEPKSLIAEKNYTKELKLNIDTNLVYVSDIDYARDTNSWKEISTPLSYFHPDPSLDFEPYRFKSQLHFSNGKHFYFRPTRASSPSPNVAPLQAAIGKEFQIYKLEKSEPCNIFDIPKKDFILYQGKNGLLKIDLTFSLLRYQKVGELALKVGSIWQKGAQKITIKEISRTQTGAVVIFDYQWANLDFRPQRFDKTSTDDFYYLLVNPKMKQAIWVPQYMIGRQFIFNTSAARLKRRECWLSYENPRNTTHSLPFELNSEWFAHAKLICLKPVVIGADHKEFQVDNFIMKED